MQQNFFKSTTALVMTLSLIQPIAVSAQDTVTIECTPELLSNGVACLDPQTKELQLLVPAEIAKPNSEKSDSNNDGRADDKSNDELKAIADAAQAEADAKAAEIKAAVAAADAAAKLAADAAAKLAADDAAAKLAADDAAAKLAADDAAAKLAADDAAAKLAADAAAKLAADDAAAKLAADAAAKLAADDAAAKLAADDAAAKLAADDAAAKLAADDAAAKLAADDAAAKLAADAAAKLAADDAAAKLAADDAAAKLAADDAAAKLAADDAAAKLAADAAAKLAADDAAAKLAADAAGRTTTTTPEPEIAQDCEPLAPGIVCDVPTVAPITQAAMATEAEPAQSDVETRTFTENDTRNSTQEFDNAVSVAPAAKNEGLSSLEKAGLLVLGAVVVGAIINKNQKVVANTGDRVVVQDPSGDYRVYKDDNTLMMQPGATVRTETFGDGSTRSFVLREDDSQIVTIRDADGRVQRRIHIDARGRETSLIDDTRIVDNVDLRTLPRRESRNFEYADTSDEGALRQALLVAAQQPLDRRFSLRQVREIREVRDLVLEVNLNAITFETDSAAIAPAQASQLQQLGDLMAEIIDQNPSELFLVEGHTDAIGGPAYNLALSDRRAETIALALSEYFDVPPENMVVQGYGEQFPRIPTLEAERLNRRVSVRQITGLLN